MKAMIIAVAALFSVVAAAEVPQPGASSSGLSYDSAFAGYRPYADTPLQPWRQAHERLAARAGTAASGHGMAGMQAGTPGAPPSAQGAKPLQPAVPQRGQRDGGS